MGFDKYPGAEHGVCESYAWQRVVLNADVNPVEDVADELLTELFRVTEPCLRTGPALRVGGNAVLFLSPVNHSSVSALRRVGKGRKHFPRRVAGPGTGFYYSFL